ncbi:MAG: prepilin-type N-terminal cleavage/methylation domain-containing protein [Pyrinomonadaceae bacterium]
MKIKRRERGFSLIELLLVCAVVGIIATVAVPHLRSAIRATDNSGTFDTLRTISSTQMSFYYVNSRFARLTEINNLLSGSVGTASGNDITRGKFVLTMSPSTPSDVELRNGYAITATRDSVGEGQVYVYELTQSGEIRQILP